MGRWFRVTRSGALALVVAATFAQCGGGGDGGGSTNVIRLFFGINGEGSCSSVVVNVDLADADAILARTSTGAPQCGIDTTLASLGCQAVFAEINAGTNLRATISGCTIPAVTNLFSCLFEDVDISDINQESSATCACKVAGCDPNPPLCIDEDLDPRSCEVCDNGVDDDGNGLEDCADPNCEHSPLCQPTTTTEEGTTTTREPVTTTTTLPPGPISIDFALTAAAKPLGALQFTVNYTSAPGRFVGDGEDVACTNKVTGALFVANANDGTSKLQIGFASVDGIEAPTELVSCLFEPDTPVPVPSNFTIVVNDATDTDAVRVRNVQIGVTVVTGEE